jgi:NAD(P)-dependent dehydrogenase (short-subunit alcohol dehydrogenase family)
MSKSTSARPVAVVTGASRGIGRAVAIALAQQGWDVCFSFVSNQAAAQDTQAEIEAAGARALAVRADASQRADIQALFAATIEAFGRVDALINNAGIIGGQRSILDADEAHLNSVFQTNVLSYFFCVSEATRLMSTQLGGQGGSIVNMSSAAARHGGLPLEAHYAASKGAIDSFTVALAKELAPHGIRVNAVRPGLISTDIHDAHGGQEVVEKLASTIPIGRAGQAEEVAQVVAFLAGGASSYMHGALVDVSGGR